MSMCAAVVVFFKPIFSLEIRLNHHLREKKVSVFETPPICSLIQDIIISGRDVPEIFAKRFLKQRNISVHLVASAPHKFSFPVKHICRCRRENLVFCFISMRGCCALKKNITWFFGTLKTFSDISSQIGGRHDSCLKGASVPPLLKVKFNDSSRVVYSG